MLLALDNEIHIERGKIIDMENNDMKGRIEENIGWVELLGWERIKRRKNCFGQGKAKWKKGEMKTQISKRVCKRTELISVKSLISEEHYDRKVPVVENSCEMKYCGIKQ